MPGNKSRSCYKKKRKGIFNGVPRFEKDIPGFDNEQPQQQHPAISDQASNQVPTSSSTPTVLAISNVSKRKLANSLLQEEVNQSILTRKRRKLMGSPSKHKGTIEAHGNKIMNSKLLVEVINIATKCVKCSKKGKFRLLQNNDKRKGFHEVLTLKCMHCKNEHCFESSQRKFSRGGGVAEINSRSVFAAISCGGGHTLLNKFASAMDFPCPVSNNSYNNHVSKLENAAVNDCAEKTSEAATRLKLLYDPDNTVDIVDVPVSVDGTSKSKPVTTVQTTNKESIPITFIPDESIIMNFRIIKPAL